MAEIELEAGDIIRWRDYPGAKWQTGRMVRLNGDDRLYVIDDYTGGFKGSPQQVRRHDSTGRVRWIDVQVGEPDQPVNADRRALAPPRQPGVEVSDRTRRRRASTAIVRAAMGGDGPGHYNPGTGMWRKVCPYCKREFTAKRRSTVPCDRAQCRKRHSRRPR
jgi:hypothetical protein